MGKYYIKCFTKTWYCHFQALLQIYSCVRKYFSHYNDCCFTVWMDNGLFFRLFITGCISLFRLPWQSITHRVALNNRNLLSQFSEAQTPRARCQQGHTPFETCSGKPFLASDSFWPFARCSLAPSCRSPALFSHAPAWVRVVFPLCLSLWPHFPFLWEHQRLGLGPTQIPYFNLITVVKILVPNKVWGAGTCDFFVRDTVHPWCWTWRQFQVFHSFKQSSDEHF